VAPHDAIPDADGCAARGASVTSRAFTVERHLPSECRHYHETLQVRDGVEAEPPARKPNVVEADGASEPL
jgi:hypothetical protein